MDNKRMSRVDGEIQKSLAEIISRFDDAVISTSLISIMKVETFSDLSMSRIYVSVFGNEEKKKQVVDKLNENKKSIRYDLAHKVRLRTIPELVFIVDDLEEKAERVMKLFEQIEEENPNIIGEKPDEE